MEFGLFFEGDARMLGLTASRPGELFKCRRSLLTEYLHIPEVHEEPRMPTAIARRVALGICMFY